MSTAIPTANTTVQLVVFDMAGTTVKDENEVEQCFFAAADATGLRADRDRIISMMGWSKKRVFQTLWQEQLGDAGDIAPQVEASYRKFKEVLEHHYLTQPVQPTEGCLELFEWLKSQGIQIALNTGFYREVTNIILDRLHWNHGLDQDFIGSKDRVIQASVTPSEIYQQQGRPAPYMIQKAMYQLGVKDPQAVVVVGDTPSDLQAGINAHCRMSLGVTCGTHTTEQLAVYPNHGLLSSLRDLKAIIAP
ncbi:MAG: HAD hydrolase-like protein [Oscillatoriophycideae cyanobacterium NC_groundwater_1537_Pr4_S-0.65um_50_18]|nr:HAD hydrolase-like protein [Oscillatoriophycideae cyanobacterium NC_groundwater_1537_Pr4_S-0.65um_50_18]